MILQRLKARALWVTLIDAGLLVCAAAAIVIALGGRTRLDVAGVRITLRAATNFVIFAAAFGALRVWLGHGLRPLPAVPVPSRAAIDAERERFATPEAATRAVWCYAAAALLGALVWIVPHLRHPWMVPDAGDPLFSAWRIARLAHQLTTDPRHLFDGNIFYPLPLTLTYSDATILEAMLGVPFVLAGVDPLLVANALTLLAFPACGLAFFYASWRLTGDPRAALVAAMIGAWYQFHAEHYPHLELQWVMFVPLAIVTGLRMLAAPRWSTGLAFGAAVTAQWLSSMYVGVMLVSFLAPFMLVAALGWRVRPSWRLATALLTAGAIVVPAFVGLSLPYLNSRGTRGDRSLQAVSDGSASPSDYGSTHIRMTTYMGHSRAGNKPERQLFPGTTTLALAGLGMVPPLTAGGIATIVAGSLTFDWSLGFKGLTYDDLYKRSVAHRGMRVPARFSVVVGAALALLGAFGAARVLRLGRTPAARGGICAALTLAVLFDLRMDPMLVPYRATIPSIYNRVTPDMVLVELPVEPQIDYMYFSTRHWARLLGGYSGYTGYSNALLEGWTAFPSAAAIEKFRGAGATHLTYNCALEKRRNRCEPTLNQLDAIPALALVASERWEGAEVRLYRIKPAATE
jgi:hypothetical protein